MENLESDIQVPAVKKIASGHVSIVVTSEADSGKEVIARYIRAENNRAGGPFVAINCSIISEHLLETEVFEHIKDAFAGASEKKPDFLQEAEVGTLFLDEIGDLNPGFQAKLLKILQEKKIKRIGEDQLRPVEASEHLPLHVPDLKRRTEDIMSLAEYFLFKHTVINNFSLRQFSEESKKHLLEKKWSGLVRELENSIERAVVMSTGETIELDELVVAGPDRTKPGITTLSAESATEPIVEIFKVSVEKSLPPLQQVVQKYIEFAVSRNGGAKDRTAKEIGIDRKTLYRKIKSFDSCVQ